MNAQPPDLFPDDFLAPGRREIAPGAVHLPGWLTVREQRWIVGQFAQWSRGPVPLDALRLPGGQQMSVRTLGLGWHWKPYQYTRTGPNGEPVLPFPEWLSRLGRRAVAEATGDPADGERYRPDAALVNFYDDGAKMGMHQDKDEATDAPVVSLSIGERCLFRFGNPQTRTKPYTDVHLASGDLFVFGGPSRLAFHGVPKIYPGTANPDCGLPRGRLNLTLRMTGRS